MVTLINPFAIGEYVIVPAGTEILIAAWPMEDAYVDEKIPDQCHVLVTGGMNLARFAENGHEFKTYEPSIMYEDEFGDDIICRVDERMIQANGYPVQYFTEEDYYAYRNIFGYDQ